MSALTGFRGLTFDCYGTLIDWESGIWDALQPLLRRARRDDITRNVALEAFAQTESACQAQTPRKRYPDLLTEVHRRLAGGFALATDEALDRRFGESVPYWPAFPDSADALRALKHHFKLVILSNVDRDGFASSDRRLGVDFDAIYTAEDVGSYKPNSANFEYMLTHLEHDLGLGRDDILHTAQSLFHDHVPARQAGLACAWIDRQGLEGTENWGATAKVTQRPSVDYVFPSLVAMAQAVGEAQANATATQLEL